MCLQINLPLPIISVTLATLEGGGVRLIIRRGGVNLEAHGHHPLRTENGSKTNILIKDFQREIEEASSAALQ